MAGEIIMNITDRETRLALIEDGQVSEIHIERKGERGIVGNIYKGRVIKVLPGMQAAFVDIGLSRAAFLYVGDIHPHNQDLNFVVADEEEEEPEKQNDQIPEVIHDEIMNLLPLKTCWRRVRIFWFKSPRNLWEAKERDNFTNFSSRQTPSIHADGRSYRHIKENRERTGTPKTKRDNKPHQTFFAAAL